MKSRRYFSPLSCNLVSVPPQVQWIIFLFPVSGEPPSTKSFHQNPCVSILQYIAISLIYIYISLSIYIIYIYICLLCMHYFGRKSPIIADKPGIFVWFQLPAEDRISLVPQGSTEVSSNTSGWRHPARRKEMVMGQNPVPLVNIKIAGIYGCE